jgi:carbon storage regulator
MLILTRRPGESIVIGGNIKVTVLGISGKQVLVRIEAPPDVSIAKSGNSRDELGQHFR